MLKIFLEIQRTCKCFNFLKNKYLESWNFKDSFLKLFNSKNYLVAVGINSILGILVVSSVHLSSVCLSRVCHKYCLCRVCFLHDQSF